MLDTLGAVFAHMATPEYWIAFSIGLAIATALGLIPGLGATVMMAIAFPIVILTFEEPAIGVVMLAVITGTGNTFDSIPAQLMGITTGGTQVSFLEGHQLARKGLAAYSLGAVYAVSAIGGIVGAAALLIVMQVAEPLILSLSFSELAVLSLFGLSMVAVLSKGAMLKGLASATIGVFLGTVGLQTFTNTERFIFGQYDLRSGLPLVAVVAGVMAIPEMLDLAASRKPVAPPDAVVSNREVFRGFVEGLRNWKLAIKHSVLGVLLGALPGTGGSFVTWMSYGLGVAASKDKREFGKGSLKGLLFAESAENSKEGGQAIPSLALGIPGSTSWALVIAALLAYGISPGPRLVANHSDIIWLIVFSFALANLLVTMLALLVTRQVIRITQIPYPAIIGTVMPIVVLGAYFADPIIQVLPVIAVMALLGLVMKHFRWPRPPLVLGFVLAAPIEENLFTAVNLFGGWGIVTRPFTIVMALISAFIIWRLLRSMNKTAGLLEESLESSSAPEAVAILTTDHGPGAAGVTDVAVVEGASPARGHAGSVTTLGSAGDGPGGDGPGGDGPGGERPAGHIPAARSGDEPVSHGDPPPAAADSPVPRRRWRAQHWVALGFTLAGLYILYTSLTYDRLGAKLLPALMGAGLAVAAGAHLIALTVSREEKKQEVLDIAMRSVGVEGARRVAYIMAGLSGLYLLLIFAIGIKWAGLVFAILTPLALMKTNRGRLVSAAVAATLYVLFATGIGDNLLYIRWQAGWFF